MPPGWSKSWRRFRIVALDEVSINTRLGDLGFDSLMFVELAQAIENAGGTIDRAGTSE